MNGKIWTVVYCEGFRAKLAFDTYPRLVVIKILLRNGTAGAHSRLPQICSSFEIRLRALCPWPSPPLLSAELAGYPALSSPASHKETLCRIRGIQHTFRLAQPRTTGVARTCCFWGNCSFCESNRTAYLRYWPYLPRSRSGSTFSSQTALGSRARESMNSRTQ